MCRQKRQELQQSPKYTTTECPRSRTDLSSGRSTLKHAPPPSSLFFLSIITPEEQREWWPVTLMLLSTRMAETNQVSCHSSDEAGIKIHLGELTSWLQTRAVLSDLKLKFLPAQISFSGTSWVEEGVPSVCLPSDSSSETPPSVPT